MPHTTTKRPRVKRPDFRPNGKRQLKAQQAKLEKDRQARVAANEVKGKLFAPLRHEKLLPSLLPNMETAASANGRGVVGGARNDKRNKGQILRKAKNNSHDDPSSSIRFRSLHKLLRQIVALEEKQTSGTKLNDAQLAKLGRFDEVVEELEEMQRILDAEEEEEDQVENENENEDKDMTTDEEEE